MYKRQLIGTALGATALAVPVSEVGKHFTDKNRTLATGIVTAAASIGYFLAPLFTKYSLGEVGWQETFKYFMYFVVFGAIACLFLLPSKKNSSNNIITKEQTFFESMKENEHFEPKPENSEKSFFDRVKDMFSCPPATIIFESPDLILWKADATDRIPEPQTWLIMWAGFDIGIPAFIAAYSGQSAEKINLNPVNKKPLPNWNINYTGLMKIKSFKKIFNRFSLVHGYRSSMTINNFQTNLDFHGIEQSKKNGLFFSKKIFYR